MVRGITSNSKYTLNGAYAFGNLADATTSTGGIFGDGASSVLMFKINSGEAMRLNNLGNLGIGIQSAVNKLDVVGNISCSIITASLFNGTASYATTSLTAVSASYASNSIWATSASYASASSTASFLVAANRYVVADLTGSIFGTSSWSNTSSFLSGNGS